MVKKKVTDIYEKPRSQRGWHVYGSRQSKNYDCIVCGRRFWEYENLKEHQKRMHTEAQLTKERERRKKLADKHRDTYLKKQVYTKKLKESK